MLLAYIWIDRIKVSAKGIIYLVGNKIGGIVKIGNGLRYNVGCLNRYTKLGHNKMREFICS